MYRHHLTSFRCLSVAEILNLLTAGQGMLYYLTKSDKILPARMEPHEPVAPEVWSYGESFTASQWEAKLTVMHHQHPVIVFSKVCTS